MSVTCHGDKRAANNTFDAVKKHIAGNPSNVTVLYRTLALIYNRASADPEPGFYTFKTIEFEERFFVMAFCKISQS